MEKAEVDELRLLTQHVVAQVAAYADAQLSGSLESMELLQHIVLMIDRKYTQMQHEVARVGRLSAVMIAKANAMKEQMDAIEDIDEELTELEDMVDQLDQYTGSLQSKFDQVR